MEAIKIPLVFADLETGGTIPRTSDILEVAIKILAGNSYSWKVRKDSYRVTPGALRVNKMSIPDCYEYGVTEDVIIEDLIRHTRTAASVKPKLVGWNVGFEKMFFEDLFDRHGMKFVEYFDYHVLDLASVCLYRHLKGEIPFLKKSEDAYKYFGVYQESDHHTAMGDTRMCEQLFLRLMK